ncbi:hypothetical protein RRG08_018980 [Elysia crispata]|uniref:Uncharacterized protein n=1 Tax=Elysia crispata TaxID=231223 RepID=A0AAE1A503_9GAST|nr:hypothetical protein RRG08_018980 [Elysia crispata]
MPSMDEVSHIEEVKPSHTLLEMETIWQSSWVHWWGVGGVRLKNSLPGSRGRRGARKLFVTGEPGEESRLTCTTYQLGFYGLHGGRQEN